MSTLDQKNISNSSLEPSANKPQDAWNSHWQNTGEPAIDLFANNPVANCLRAFWLGRFESIRNKRVLDIGAGSGALAALALELKIPVGQWTCLDSATTSATHWKHQRSDLYNPRWLVGHFEEFEPTHKVDAFVSNFGIEYSNLNLASERCSLWANANALIALVLHAKDSIIDQQSIQSSEDLQFLLEQTDFKQATLRLIQVGASLPEDSTERMMHGVDERDDFNVQVNKLKAYMEASGRRSPVLIQSLQLATMTVGNLIQAQQRTPKPSVQNALLAADTALQSFTAYIDSLMFEFRRLEQMRGAALDKNGAQALLDRLKHCGFEKLRLEPIAITNQDLPSEPLLVAWTIQN
jgi:16S rRNA G527 N7-methylase RsmG